MKATLSPKELAQIVGASESSLKRWADNGMIRAQRTVGGHRRIPVQEAIRFVRESNLPVLRPELLGLPELNRVGELREDSDVSVDDLLFDKLRAGDGADVRALIIDRYLAGESVANLCDRTLRRAMHRIGEIWQHRSEGIFVEHRATDICIQCVNLLRSLVQSDDAWGRAGEPVPVAVGGAPSDDPYLLPSLMMACVLADAGFRDVNLGADTPVHAFEAAALEHGASVLWVSCSVATAMPAIHEIERLAAALREQDAIMLIGGQGIDPARLPKAPNIRVCDTVTEGLAFAKAHVANGTEATQDNGNGR